MQVVVRSNGCDEDLDLELRSPRATLGDLAVAVTGVGPGDAVGVGGLRLPAHCLVTDAGLVQGGLVDLGGSCPFVPPPEQPAAAHEVVAVAGLDAGGRWPLHGVALVGRASGAAVRLAHPTVSREHCTLAVAADGRLVVSDVGARNAVVVDERVLRRGESVTVDLTATVRLGAVELQVRERTDDRPHGLHVRRQVDITGTLPLNRPPRGAPPGPAPTLDLPVPPGERVADPLSIAAVVGPLVLAAVMVGVTGDPRFALFSALSPVLAIGSWYESRRRARRGGRRDRARYAHELAALTGVVRDAAAAERARLRSFALDPAEVLRRAALPSSRLWERRPGAPDVLLLSAGTADQVWRPPVEAHVRPPPDVEQVLGGGLLVAAPVLVDLSAGGVIGVVGDRAAALAVARQLLCAATVTSGPADLTVGVFVDPGLEDDWDWCRWLPHTRAALPGADRWLSADRAGSDVLLRALAGGAGAATTLVVLDSARLTSGPDAPARDLLSLARRPAPPGAAGGPGLRVGVAGIVLAATADALPAACDQVLEARVDGTAVLSRLGSGVRVGQVLLAGLTLPRARECARHLARFEDPELVVAGAGLPTAVRLLPLLELPHVGAEIDVDAVRSRWRAGGADPGAVTPLGVTETGLFILDLVRDGAHGLVGGTTGSGKSELLRSLVAGLAASADARHLTFVLIDYKGGAAFDVCARLPHVVGLVTDLDEQLGERALRALEAELHTRERTLRAAGADDLPAYLALGLPEPLPRLVVVIDEFATLAQELPGFVSSLIGIAQRGRTLGVHLLLATQRPSGAVKDDIRANTNLRIALRVQDSGDSTDVLGTTAAAQIRRDRPGRAYVRLGPGEVVPIQTALVTCVSEDGSDEPVDAARLVFGPLARGPAVRPPGQETPGAAPAPAGPARTDLARLVDALVAAHEAEGFPAPRRPWPPPLPAELDLAALLDGVGARASPAARPSTTDRAPGEALMAEPRLADPQPADQHLALVALADDPRRQVQHPVGWDLSEGGLLLFGVPGSGTTTALLSLALSLAYRSSPSELELYGLDFGMGGLAGLTALPHTAAVVQADDRERQVRLLHRLATELARRRADGTTQGSRRIVVLLDNLAAMRAAYDDVAGLELLDLLARLHADGPQVGICFAMTADRPAAVPMPIASVTTQRWLFRLADPFDYSAVGLARTDIPAALPGRAVLATSRLQAQLARPGPDLPDRVAARWAGAARPALPLRRLPARVSPDELGPASCPPGLWRLPVGLAEADLSVAELPLYEGESVLVTGPARSGKSSVLCSLSGLLRAGGARVVGTGGRRSPLQAGGDLDRWVPAPDLALALAGLADTERPTALLVDDAESVDDADGGLAALLRTPVPGVHLIVAGRSDALRTLYGHWTAAVRLSRTGLLLRPNVDLDGDLLGVTLPRRSPVPPGVARGYLVTGGEASLVQAATGPAAASR
ncbi:MAG TPA: FtsK/SpoIIIE domain-containing protein [Mycobacteriales bacterium]|jgi:S-DNA-T family DNA segregation ATPase FtsK/SpoIIIE|nr:FtsK/SpoIIIE domain-containing protein [Mycobacteriales bacterium]